MTEQEEFEFRLRLEQEQAQRPAAPTRQPSPLESFMQNLAAGGIRGAAGIGSTLMTPYDWAVGNTRSLLNPERRRAVDEAIASFQQIDPESAAFKAGKIGTEVAGTLGVGPALAGVRGAAAVAPNLTQAVRTAGMAGGNVGTRTAGAAITGGVSGAAVNPEDTAQAAGISAALPGVLRIAGAGGQAVGTALRPEASKSDLALKAIRDYNIPLSLSQVSDNQTVKAAQSILNDIPIVGRGGRKAVDRTQEAFNRAVGATFGAPEASLTPEVLDAAKKRMGSEFERIWGRNVLQYDSDMLLSIQRLRDEAKMLPQGEASRLTRWIDDIESKMMPGPDGQPMMPGDAAQRMQSKLREDAEKATGFLKSALEDLRGTMLGAFNRGVSPEDANALRMTMRQYKAFKTVEPLLQGAQVGVAGRTVGDVPAGLLPQKVRDSYRGNIAQSPFSDLSQIGSQFLTDRVPRTGGSSRALLQNASIPGLMAAGYFGNPLVAAGGAAGLLGAQGLLSSPAVARLLLEGAEPGLLSIGAARALPALSAQ